LLFCAAQLSARREFQLNHIIPRRRGNGGREAMMKPVRRVLTVLTGVGLIFLTGAHSFAESIYHWKDRNGIPHYSNATIPNEAREDLVVYSASALSGSDEDSGVTDDPETGGGGMLDSSGSDMAPDSKAAVLRNRIERRQASIHDIENLLKTHPNDAGLRSRYYRTRRYLQEDIVRLKLLTN